MAPQTAAPHTADLIWTFSVRHCCPAKEAWAEGAGSSDGGPAASTLEFVVHMKHDIVTKPPDLRVAIFGTDMPMARVDLHADLARVEWSTARAGLYLINVMMGNASIRGSPFTVAVREMCATESKQTDRPHNVCCFGLRRFFRH
jgi:hypothetical protein